MIEHVLSESDLTLETRVANIAERMCPQMGLEHVQAHHADDTAKTAPIDGFFSGGDKVGDEIAVCLELLTTLEAGIHAESMSSAKVLHHFLDREVAHVTQITRIRFVEGFHTKFMVHFSGCQVGRQFVFVCLFVRDIFHKDVAHFGKETILRVLSESTEKVIAVGGAEVNKNVFQAGFVRLVAKADGTVKLLDFSEGFLNA